MEKHPQEFVMCIYNVRSGFWDIGDRKVSLMSETKQNLHLIFHNTNPKNDQNVTVMQQDSLWQILHSLQAKANTEVHNRTTTWTSTLFLHASNHNSVSCMFLPYDFASILNTSPNLKTCSNLEQLTHNKPLQCHQFVLHGLAYLRSTSGTWYYIQQTQTEGLWSIKKLEPHTSAVSHTLPSAQCQYMATKNTFSLFSSQCILVRKVCPSRFSWNLAGMSCY
jgi:hypothetical protein